MPNYYSANSMTLYRLISNFPGSVNVPGMGDWPGPPPLAPARGATTFGFYLLRLAMPSSVVPLVTNSYKMACPDLGRSTRPRPRIYSRLVLCPLTRLGTRQSGP